MQHLIAATGANLNEQDDTSRRTEASNHYDQDAAFPALAMQGAGGEGAD
jgi:hypothetical protein